MKFVFVMILAVVLMTALCVFLYKFSKHKPQ